MPRPRAHLALPALHQGPHEDDVAQGREVALARQRGVCLTAWLSFSCETGLVHQEVCDLGGAMREGVVPAPQPVSWFSKPRTVSNTLMSLVNRQQTRNQETRIRTWP